MTAIFFTLTWQKIKLHHLIKAPSTRLHDIFFNPQLFLSGFGFRPLKHPVNAAYESASCLIRCAEWKFLNTLWIRNLVDGKSGYVFLSGEVTRSSLILYRELLYSRVATSTHALLPIFLEESWVLERIRIRVGYMWTSKFYLNTDTCGRGKFWIRKEKFADEKKSRYVWTGPKIKFHDVTES